MSIQDGLNSRWAQAIAATSSAFLGLTMWQLSREDGAAFGVRLYVPILVSAAVGLAAAIVPRLRRVGLAWAFGNATALIAVWIMGLIILQTWGDPP